MNGTVIIGGRPYSRSLIQDILNVPLQKQEKVNEPIIELNGDDIRVLKSYDQNGVYFPAIKRIVFNDPSTCVWFTDGTKVVVKTSANDKYDKEVGLIYALVKRIYGKYSDSFTGRPNADEMIDGNGFGTYIKKLVKAGFDQKEVEAKQRAEKKAKADKKNLAVKEVASGIPASEPAVAK
jgi:hypothetical protein